MQLTFNEIRRSSFKRVLSKGEFKAETKGNKHPLSVHIPSDILVFDKVVIFALDYVSDSYFHNNDYFVGRSKKVMSYERLVNLTKKDLYKKEYRRLFCRMLSWIIDLSEHTDRNSIYMHSFENLNKKFFSWYSIPLDEEISLYSLRKYYYQLSSRKNFLVWERLSRISGKPVVTLNSET